MLLDIPLFYTRFYWGMKTLIKNHTHYQVICLYLM